MNCLIGCGGGGEVSIIPENQSFEVDVTAQDKIDILWVVDCSESMIEEIDNVRSNIKQFISEFVSLGYDYRMGVVTTTAWAQFAYDSGRRLNALKKFNLLHTGEATGRDSTRGGRLPKYIASGSEDPLERFDVMFDVSAVSHCGRLRNRRTSNYIADERGMQSIEAFLSRSPDVESFLREDAFFAAIVISDERDASRDDLVPLLDRRRNPREIEYHQPQRYLGFLDEYFGSEESSYRVYSIAKLDEPELGMSYVDFALGSGGLALNIDAPDYSEQLSTISGSILEVVSQFTLKSRPVPSSLRVQVTYTDSITNQSVTRTIPQDPASRNGFTYFEEGNFLRFYGSYRLPAQAVVNVAFDPLEL